MPKAYGRAPGPSQAPLRERNLRRAPRPTDARERHGYTGGSMASAELTGDLRVNKDSPILRQQLRLLTRVATIVAILTSPAVFFTWATVLHHRFWLSFFLTIVTVLGFRGFVDVVTRRLIPWPSLYGAA